MKDKTSLKQKIKSTLLYLFDKVTDKVIKLTIVNSFQVSLFNLVSLSHFKHHFHYSTVNLLNCNKETVNCNIQRYF